MLYKVHILGIPATVEVTHIDYKSADPCCIDSDIDFYGYCEIEMTICDRNGRPASWLEVKMKPSDHEDLRQQVMAQLDAIKLELEY